VILSVLQCVYMYFLDMFFVILCSSLFLMFIHCRCKSIVSKPTMCY
jgi:hypothetical protein